MSKYNDSQKFKLRDGRTLIIDGVIIQTVFLNPGEDYEPYTYYNYHIEDAYGNVVGMDCSVTALDLDRLLEKEGEDLYS